MNNSTQGFNTEIDALTRAIGRVTMQSAAFEGCLRSILQELMGIGGSGWILIEGQSLEWLQNTLPVVLEMEDSHNTIWTVEQHLELKKAAGAAKPLQAHRNSIVHGTWSKPPKKKRIDYEEYTDNRPWGDPDDGSEWLCFRSRHRRYANAQRWTVADVELLADKWRDAYTGIATAYAKMEQTSNPEDFDKTVWAEHLPT